MALTDDSRNLEIPGKDTACYNHFYKIWNLRNLDHNKNVLISWITESKLTKLCRTEITEF